MTDPLTESWEIIEAQEVVIETQMEYIAILESVCADLIIENAKLRRDLWFKISSIVKPRV